MSSSITTKIENFEVNYHSNSSSSNSNDTNAFEAQSQTIKSIQSSAEPKGYVCHMHRHRRVLVTQRNAPTFSPLGSPRKTLPRNGHSRTC